MSVRRNGRDHEKMREEQRADAEHRGMQENMWARDSEYRTQYLREITEQNLDPATEELLGNLLSSALVLANLQDAEVTEIRWLVETVFMTVKRMHPHPDSYLAGDYRAALLDDPDDTLTPLSAKQETALEQAKLIVIESLTRSRGGWQQDEMSKQYTVSKREDDSDGGDRIGGLMS